MSAEQYDQAKSQERALRALADFATTDHHDGVHDDLIIEPLRHGHIHHTWIVSSSSGDHFVLQELNAHVFRQPERVAENIVTVTDHLAQAVAARNEDPRRRCLQVIRTRSGGAMAVHGTGEDELFFRLFSFVPSSRALLEAENAEQAYAAARAIARFQLDLADLDPDRLHETLPRFHDTPNRFEALDRAIASDEFARLADCRSDVEKALEWRPFATVLLDPHARGEIPRRIAHNDAKISNVLFDAEEDHGICVIDLDTVMPGLSLYDFGEMVRSMASHSPEDSQHPSDLELDMEHLEALRAGYLDLAADFLTDTERSLLLESGMLMTLENGIRFLTDHLEGDHYFAGRRPGQNLDRCRTQFALLNALSELRGQW